MIYLERPAAGNPAGGHPAGLLILHHGRGTDEHDLLGLADLLDPQRRLHVVTPRAPLAFPGWPGYHWYMSARVGHPEPRTFDDGYRELAAFHDETWARTGLDPGQTVLGGFSMGAVMSYSLGLAGDRPVPAGILAFSGFVPIVDGWTPDLGSRSQLPVFIAHGRQDPIIDVEFGRRARQLLEAAGLPVTYSESDLAHQISPADLPAASAWLAAATADQVSTE